MTDKRQTVAARKIKNPIQTLFCPRLSGVVEFVPLSVFMVFVVAALSQDTKQLFQTPLINIPKKLCVPIPLIQYVKTEAKIVCRTAVAQAMEPPFPVFRLEINNTFICNESIFLASVSTA